MQATIASGATASSAVSCQIGCTDGCFEMPASFTGTAVTFQRSLDGTNFKDYVASGDSAAFSQDVSAGQSIDFPPGLLRGAQAIKIVSDAAEAADRTILVRLLMLGGLA